MPRFHFFRNLKTAIWLLFFTLIPCALLSLYWANKTGLPDEWREALELEISKYGVHVEIASLTYMPLRGFIAQNIQIFADEQHLTELSRFESVQLVLDNASLALGKFKLKKIDLNNARLSLPVDPTKPTGPSLRLSSIYGTIFQSGERLIEIRNARGQVGGIDFTLNARLLRDDKKSDKAEDEKNQGRRRELIANILNELNHWDLDPQAHPIVHLDIQGDLSEKTTLRVDFDLSAPSIQKKQYKLTNLQASGKLSGNLLTVDSFRASDPNGSLTGHADYHLTSHTGRFDLNSSIDITRLLDSWLSVPLTSSLTISGRKQIQAAGDFDLTTPTSPLIHITGHALCQSLKFRSVAFTSVETHFSWQNGNLFLSDLTLKRPDGTARAKILKQANLVKLTLDSTLPAPLFKPFFPGQPLEQVIADFTENTNPSTAIHLEGSFNTTDHFAWQYSGHGTVKNLSYCGVPVESASCSFALDHNSLDFFDGTATFDYRKYPLRNAYQGPATGTAKVGRIRYDAIPKTITVEAVSGDVWAAPLVRFFAPKIADNLEQYRFHTPPSLRGSGLVDVTPKGRTDLLVTFSTPGNADYKFLGKDITLTRPQARVSIKGSGVRVSDLSADTFGGPISGSFFNSKNSLLTGDLSWSRLSIKDLSATYDFDMKGKGNTTGRIDFSMQNGDVKTMSGEGLIGIEKAELFSFPIFGPLSPVMSAVLNDKRSGFERAKAAFCTFQIKDGILSTTDFQTATSSITFAGDGSINLAQQAVDFTVRLNTRGLLGLITLPLRPLASLFEFRGTGTLRDTKWRNVRFTTPPEKQQQILLTPPPKATIIAE